MSEITFLASSKRIKIPDEIVEYNHRTVHDKGEDAIYFAVQKLDTYWKEKVNGIFTLPYVYQAHGVGNSLFLTYLDKYMEVGHVLELYHVRSQNQFDEFRRRMEEAPKPIEINAGSYTYKDIYGSYQFEPKRWLEELRHRNYIGHHGITTIVKY